MHATGQRDLVAGAESARSQELHDHHQHTVPGVSGHVFLCRKHGDHVRVFDTDGPERGLLGRPVFHLHRRSVRAEAQGRTDVRHERVLLRRFAAVRHHLRHHQTVEVDRAHQHGDTDHDYRHSIHGGSLLLLYDTGCVGFVFLLFT